MSEYQLFLQRLHADLVAPHDLIVGTIQSATRQGIRSKTRIIAGEVNEVYDVELDDLQQVILRISRDSRADFEQEAWATECCRRAGVPVATTIAITHSQLNGQPIHTCVQTKIAGQPLELSGSGIASWSAGRKQKVMADVGRILSRIHSIPTLGFGLLDGHGCGEFATFSELMREFASQEEWFLKIASDTTFDTILMKNILRYLNAKSLDAPEIKPRLNHNDFELKHIMVQGDQVTGILDFGAVSGHSPVNDLARWDYLYDQDLPLVWLQAGYENKEVFQGDFPELLPWLRLNYGLNVLSWYYQKQYPPMIKAAKKKLTQMANNI